MAEGEREGGSLSGSSKMPPISHSTLWAASNGICYKKEREQRGSSLKSEPTPAGGGICLLAKRKDSTERKEAKAEGPRGSK